MCKSVLKKGSEEEKAEHDGNSAIDLNCLWHPALISPISSNSSQKFSAAWIIVAITMLFMLHQAKMDYDASVKKIGQSSAPSTPTTESAPPQQSGASSFHSKEVPVIWILGGPGSGKGTQCDRIVAKYKFSHFSTGDLLRDEVKSGSEKGKQLSEMMARGDLVPNDEVLGLLKNAMAKVADSTVGYLIDGYPREKSQGAAFEKQIAPVDIILYFECAEETMVSRIMHRAAQSAVKRADDNEETIKNRIHTFRTNTEEILSQYGDKVKRIPADRPVDDIFNDVVANIDQLLASRK